MSPQLRTIDQAQEAEVDVFPLLVAKAHVGGILAGTGDATALPCQD